MNTLFLKKLVTRDRCFLFLLTPNREPLRRRRSICSSGTRAIGEHVRLRRMPSGSLEPPPREGAAFFFGRCCSFCSSGETSLTGDPQSACRDVESRSPPGGCKPEVRRSPHPRSQLAGAPPLLPFVPCPSRCNSSAENMTAGSTATWKSI